MAAPELNRQVHGIDKDLARGVCTSSERNTFLTLMQQELKMEMDSTSVKEALIWLEKLTGEPVSGADFAHLWPLLISQGWISGRRFEPALSFARR